MAPGDDETDTGDRSDDEKLFPAGKKHQQQELFTGQVGRDLFMVFSSTKLLLGCADNRSELHYKDKRDPGDESHGGSRDKIVVVQIWQPTLIVYPLRGYLLGIHCDVMVGAGPLANQPNSIN